MAGSRITFSVSCLRCLPLIYKNQFLSRWVRISVSRCRVIRRVKLAWFKDREFDAFSKKTPSSPEATANSTVPTRCRQDKRGFGKGAVKSLKSWLGRQDSNLGMAESKSDQFSNKFNAHSEKIAKFDPLLVNRLAVDSEYRRTHSRCERSKQAGATIVSGMTIETALSKGKLAPMLVLQPLQ
jgi:hypothetical protein